MGNYLNPGSTLFRYSLRSEIYVDKSGLIEKTNKLINTEQTIHLCEPTKTFWKIYGSKYAGCILQQRRKYRRTI